MEKETYVRVLQLYGSLFYLEEDNTHNYHHVNVSDLMAQNGYCRIILNRHICGNFNLLITTD